MKVTGKSTILGFVLTLTSLTFVTNATSQDQRKLTFELGPNYAIKSANVESKDGIELGRKDFSGASFIPIEYTVVLGKPSRKVTVTLDAELCLQSESGCWPKPKPKEPQPTIPGSPIPGHPNPQDPKLPIPFRFDGFDSDGKLVSSSIVSSIKSNMTSNTLSTGIFGKKMKYIRVSHPIHNITLKVDTGERGPFEQVEVSSIDDHSSDNPLPDNVVPLSNNGWGKTVVDFFTASAQATAEFLSDIKIVVVQPECDQSFTPPPVQAPNCTSHCGSDNTYIVIMGQNCGGGTEY